jgi:hypothetical protein
MFHSYGETDISIFIGCVPALPMGVAPEAMVELFRV